MARLQPSPATAKWLTPWRATACNAALHGCQSLPMLPGQLVAMAAHLDPMAALPSDDGVLCPVAACLGGYQARAH